MGDVKMTKDDRVREILSKFDEDFASTTWLVQGQRVIYHSALERIAARAGIRFDKPEIIRSQEREAVILVTGSMPGERFEWSIGEANMELNYRTSGKQQAYPYAMAEKRGKDRVILKLIQLHGLLYSEEEADDFKRKGQEADDDGPLEMHNPSAGEPGYRPPMQSAKAARHEIMSDAISSGKPIVTEDGEVHPSEAIKRKVQEQKTVLGVNNVMLEYSVQNYLSRIPVEHKNELRDFAKARMIDLGWRKKGND
jgi:hypothetical protein